jgi:3-oxoacyl-[acyl-carrier protein] reductase
MSAAPKVAIVSGGSRGLGQSIVQALLDDDYRVATFSRSSTVFVEEAGRTVGPARFHWQSLDARNTRTLREFARDIQRRWGSIDALVNNAGIGTEGLLTLSSEREIDETVALNLAAALHLTRACLKPMIAARSGNVLNISSVSGLRGQRGVSVYSATKAALDALTRSLAREVGPSGIRVNSVAPGYFESDMTAGIAAEARENLKRRIPLGRLGTTQDIMRVVRFMLSDAAAYVHGQVIAVDGGLSC